MKRLFLISLFSLFLAAVLPAYSVTDENPIDSPLSAVSYTGRFADVFANPAALPLMEIEPGPFAISLNLSDDLDSSLFGNTVMPLLQNQKWSIGASFIARYVALTAFFGNEFEKTGDVSSSSYDIHSSLRIEVDMAYSIPHFSIGLRVSGGNKMIRRDKVIDSIDKIFANAWFSPYERESGSESFDVGTGAIVSFGPFSGGVYIGELLTLRNEEIYIGWDAISESTTLSVSLGANRYTKDGDLRFFRPRCALSMTGLVNEDTRTVEAEAEITFQLLPESSVTFAFSYLERNHSIFAFDISNGYFNFFLRGEGNGFSGTIGVTFKADDFSRFAPMFGFSYVS